MTVGVRFRGSIAPASLKLREDEDGFADDERFPGLYCPGLIEALYRTTRQGERRRFPGLYCPGLIEAGNENAGRRVSDAVSGALLPRPH